jgi:hypothetical protein
MAKSKKVELPATPATLLPPLPPGTPETPVINPATVEELQTKPVVAVVPVVPVVAVVPDVEVTPESRVLKVKHKKTGNKFDVSRDYYDRHKSILECL